MLLATEVEGRRRLVEQEERRLLHERAAEHDPLLLAAAQGVEAAPGKRAEIEPRERAAGGLEIVRALVAERPEMGGAAEQHVLVDPHPER